MKPALVHARTTVCSDSPTTPTPPKPPKPPPNPTSMTHPVCRQHLPVREHVDAGALSLHQQVVQILVCVGSGGLDGGQECFSAAG